MEVECHSTKVIGNTFMFYMISYFIFYYENRCNYIKNTAIVFVKFRIFMVFLLDSWHSGNGVIYFTSAKCPQGSNFDRTSLSTNQRSFSCKVQSVTKAHCLQVDKAWQALYNLKLSSRHYTQLSQCTNFKA